VYIQIDTHNFFSYSKLVFIKVGDGGRVGVRVGGNQLIMFNTYSATHFWSEKGCSHLHIVLIVHALSLVKIQLAVPGLWQIPW
jgi:hypothetical protein